MPMDKKLKTKWVKSLRSGKYKQGKLLLRSTDDKFCCLGVLCTVLDKTKWLRSSDGPVYEYMGWTSVLKEKLRKKIGLSEKIQDALIEMNDSGKRFSTIANFIEKCEDI